MTETRTYCQSLTRDLELGILTSKKKGLMTSDFDFGCRFDITAATILHNNYGGNDNY
jgi:hypothetical protein